MKILFMDAVSFGKVRAGCRYWPSVPALACDILLPSSTVLEHGAAESAAREHGFASEVSSCG
jgi:hypothetical protein